MRAPAWSTETAMPANMTDVHAAFFDETQARWVFLGQGVDSGNKIREWHLSTSWVQGGPNTVLGTLSALGGLKLRNCSSYHQYCYFIGSDNDIYRVDDYTTVFASFQIGTYVLLAPYGDRMYAAESDGTIHRLNDADSAMEVFYNPVVSLDIRFIAPYRHFLVIIAAADDGSLHFYRLPDYNPKQLHGLAVMPPEGQFPTRVQTASVGTTFTIFNDEIFFAMGKYQNITGGDHTFNIYAFNGSRIRQVGQTSGTGATGFLTWKRNLLFHHYGGTKHYFHILAGEQFTPFMEVTVADAAQPPAFGLANELFVFNDPSAAWTYHHAGRTTFADGYFITSRLDFDHPGKQKRLERITVLLDGKAADVTTTIKYRTDDNDSWTTATTATNTLRATIGNLNVTFYLLQLRIELAESTGDTEDIGIHTVSVVYTVDT
jgi:hypothetical protein